MTEQNPVEDGPLGMSRRIDSRHIGMDGAGTGPGSKIRKKWIIVLCCYSTEFTSPTLPFKDMQLTLAFTLTTNAHVP